MILILKVCLNPDYFVYSRAHLFICFASQSLVISLRLPIVVFVYALVADAGPRGDADGLGGLLIVALW